MATGVDRRTGKFELADGGTLFLDEIGDLKIVAQAKILRALQENVVERVGGNKSIPVDVRVLAATNKDLEKEIKKENFREDLYYRLKVVHLQMPSLREMSSDIPLLANHYLSQFTSEMGKGEKKFSRDTLECLTNYGWPGNIRELANEIRRIVVICRRRAIKKEDLSEAIRTRVRSARKGEHSLKEVEAEAVEDLEKGMIMEAMEACRNNQLRAAAKLGLSRQGLIKKMKRYGMK